MKKSKFLALLGAGVLTLGLAGTALAATGPSDQGVTPTWHDGNIGIGKATPGKDSADCTSFDGLETGDSGGSGTTGSGVEITWTYNSDTKEFGFTATGGLVAIAYVKGGNAYNEYDYTSKPDGGVASDGSMFAPDNASEGPAGLSHAVFCTTGGTVSPPPSNPPSESPAFSQGEGGETDSPSEPSTDTFGGNGTSGPADGAWLLVVALGVLLASIVVLTPARAKSRR